MQAEEFGQRGGDRRRRCRRPEGPRPCVVARGRAEASASLADTKPETYHADFGGLGGQTSKSGTRLEQVDTVPLNPRTVVRILRLFLVDLRSVRGFPQRDGAEAFLVSRSPEKKWVSRSAA